MPDETLGRVLIAGATGYLGKFAAQAFNERGYHVRVLTRSEERLNEPGPFTAPALSKDDVDEIFVGEGSNNMTPIHGRDLAHVCVDTAEGDEREVEAEGPDNLTQRETAELAFEVVGKPPRITVIPMWLARGLVKLIGLLSTQFGDLAEFIVTAGEIDGVGPTRGTTTLRSYFEALNAGDKNA